MDKRQAKKVRQKASPATERRVLELLYRLREEAEERQYLESNPFSERAKK